MNKLWRNGLTLLGLVWLCATPAAAQHTLSEVFWGRKHPVSPAAYESPYLEEPAPEPPQTMEAQPAPPADSQLPELISSPNACQEPTFSPRCWWPACALPTGIFPWSPRNPESTRFWGPGMPLYGSSWLNRPFSFTPIVGFISGDDVIRGHVGQKTAFLGGYRFGWDYDYYWGMELRFVAAHMPLHDARGVTNPYTDDYFAGDLDLLYYPFGDTRWRPFWMLGMGGQYFNLTDEQGQVRHGTLYSLPLGLGCKYKYNDWLALRMEVTDAVAFGNGTLSTMNNFCFTGGVEARFGGSRPSYWPWYPSSHVH